MGGTSNDVIMEGCGGWGWDGVFLILACSLTSSTSAVLPWNVLYRRTTNPSLLLTSSAVWYTINELMQPPVSGWNTTGRDLYRDSTRPNVECNFRRKSDAHFSMWHIQVILPRLLSFSSMHNLWYKCYFNIMWKLLNWRECMSYGKLMIQSGLQVGLSSSISGANLSLWSEGG